MTITDSAAAQIDLPAAVLPQHFVGTPAQLSWESSDTVYGNKLERYRVENRMTRLPLEGVAEHYNLMEEESEQSYFLLRSGETSTAWADHETKWNTFYAKWSNEQGQGN